MAISREKHQKAILLLTTLRGSMNQDEWQGFLNKLGGDPLFPLPPDEAKIDAFILNFSEKILGDITPEKVVNIIDGVQLRSIVDAYERELEERTRAGELTQQRGKTYVEDFLRVAIESPGPVEQKGILYQTYEEIHASNPEKTVSEIIRKGDDTFAVKQASSPIPNDVKSDVFRYENLKDLNPVQKTIAPLMDTITDAVYSTAAPAHRERVINTVVTSSLNNLVNADNVSKGADKITAVLGSNVVNEPGFKKLQVETQNLKTRAPLQGGANTSLDNVSASVLHGASGSVVIRWTKLYVKNYKEGLPTPSIGQLQAASVGWAPSTFRTGISLGINLGLRIGINRAKNGLFTKLGLAAGETVVPGVGTAAAVLTAGGVILGKLGGWITSPFGNAPGEKRVNLIIAGFIALVVGLPILMSIFQQDFMINPALIGRLQPARGGGASTSPGEGPGGGGGLPPYPGAPAIPSDIKGCPTKNAFTISSCITWEGHVKYGECAYDITGMANGTPVVATHDGVIATRSSGSGGYGNWIEIKGQDPGGQTYYTLYAHLMAFNVQQGQQVRAGQTIGYIDNTGNSTGTHLHYELRSSTNAVMPDCGKQFLPAACVTNPGDCNIK